jgi:hypothetical protein
MAPRQKSKKCDSCKKYFPATPEFFFLSEGNRSKDGLRSSCKGCYTGGNVTTSDGLVEVLVPCWRCETPTPMSILPELHAPGRRLPIKLCYRCKSIPDDVYGSGCRHNGAVIPQGV